MSDQLISGRRLALVPDGYLPKTGIGSIRRLSKAETSAPTQFCGHGCGLRRAGEGIDAPVVMHHDIIEHERRAMVSGVGIESEDLVVGEIRMVRPRYEVYVSDVMIRVTKIEYRILELLMTFPHRVMTHGEIGAYVWGMNLAMGEEHMIRVNIARLRKKMAGGYRPEDYVEVTLQSGSTRRLLKKEAQERYIVTRQGHGYGMANLTEEKNGGE